MEWFLLCLTACCLVAAGLAVRWWMRLSRLSYPELERELLGTENSHLLPQQRMRQVDAIKPKLAILLAGLILAAGILSWKTLEAFLA